MDPILQLCHITGAGLCGHEGLAAGNSSPLEDASHQRLRLMHCHGSRRHAQSGCGLQGCFVTPSESHYHLFSTTSEICVLVSFVVEVGVCLMRSGRMMTFGLVVDPIGRVFLILSQGAILVSPRAEDPPTQGFPQQPGEDGGDWYNCTQSPTAVSLLLQLQYS